MDIDENPTRTWEPGNPDGGRTWPPTTWPDGSPITEEQRAEIDAAKARIRVEDL